MSAPAVTSSPSMSSPVSPSVSQPPSLDPSGRSHLVVAVGSGAGVAGAVEGWLGEARDAGTALEVRRVADVDERCRGELHAVLGGLRIGARVVLVGPEAAVMTLASWVRRLGVLPEEITTHVTTRGEVVVFCVHCEATATRQVSPGGVVACEGCGRELEVHDHPSGHRGSYLASAVGA